MEPKIVIVGGTHGDRALMRLLIDKQFNKPGGRRVAVELQTEQDEGPAMELTVRGLAMRLLSLPDQDMLVAYRLHSDTMRLSWPAELPRRSYESGDGPHIGKLQHAPVGEYLRNLSSLKEEERRAAGIPDDKVQDWLVFPGN